MKLLASDYDGTFKSSIKNLYINIEEVKKFRDNGNKFAIVTGRSYESIKNEINKYNIEYDYLVCNNGLIIFDNEDNIVFSKKLKTDDLMFIYNELLYMNNQEDTKIYNFYTSTMIFENILEVYAKFKTNISAKNFKKFIEYERKNLLCYKDGKKMFISNNITKADALTFIQDKEKIKKDDIYTVGDNKNDLEMLLKFNGYKMLFSYSNMWFKRFSVVKEVHSLIKKINKL